MGQESALLFESPEEIYRRVFKELRPRTSLPAITVEFRPFANPDSDVRLQDGRIVVRMSDLLADAPAPVIEALAHILLGKLMRRPVARAYTHRYRLYLNRRDVRRRIDAMRRERGRKVMLDPRGKCHDLNVVFEELNFRYFYGLMARPELGWSRTASRTMLGHYDASHNSIVISRIFDRPDVPRLALEYVLFHEMLHVRYPVDSRGAKRRVHTREFRQAEKAFEGLKAAKEALRRLSSLP
ncbi:MAG: SprT-like domain-containing protein [bacterium]|jgi:hypothetical protein